MSIKDRRIWQRYLYQRSTADVPTRSCWYCNNKNPLIETECQNCFKKLVQEGTPAEKLTLDDVRMSHAIRLGQVEAPAWKFAYRGLVSGDRVTTRAR